MYDDSEIPFVIIKNKSKDLCCAYRCGNKRPKKDRFCPKHRKRLEKKLKVLNYVYNALKSNAKRRNKFFDLTLDQFKVFCSESGYLEKRGKSGDSASIDRIINSKGYTEGNLQILSLSKNAKKGSSGMEDCPF